MKQTLELWGGVECTVARIGDDFRDQTAETGHRDRPEDLDLIAALGIRTLRYPVLWETISPLSPDEADFSWHDERLARMRVLGISPIAGLCHHGSGPHYTNLLDPAWPALLARHAGNVARRYPHLDLYTPVNEPLTTARFSGLYGHWYPHGLSYPSFLRALIHECRATVLAMREIRRVRPDAKLIQTDDLGKTFSTPALVDQAVHENGRRWLTFDLLCGMVDRQHLWWSIFRHNGISESELAFFLEADAAPDIIGVNHYLTSERFLDERLDRYPAHLWGGNGRAHYADLEAVRMPLPAQDLGPAARLRETWERYRLPIAVTECHHGCTRDEQLRWLGDVWQAAQRLRHEGADIRAVTVWSLFGTTDWNTLLTERNACYEPGTFDVRGSEPRPTALAQAAKGLAKHGSFDHPVMDGAGWWRRDSRFYATSTRRSNACTLVDNPRQILIVGATGTLGRAFARICELRSLHRVVVSRQEMDIGDFASVEAALDNHRPWAIINAAGYVRVAQAESQSDLCWRENSHGAEILANAATARGLPLVTFSTDLVFDGRGGAPYDERHVVSPTTVYGASKADAERRVRNAHPDALIIRTSAFFGPWDRHNFLWWALNRMAGGEAVDAGPDRVSPTYVPDLVHEVLNLLIDGATGIWHLTNLGETSWADLAREGARRTGLDPELVRETNGSAVLNTVLTSRRGLLLPPLHNALDRFFHQNEIDWRVDRNLSIAAE